jgi:hypothetical protein
MSSAQTESHGLWLQPEVKQSGLIFQASGPGLLLGLNDKHARIGALVDPKKKYRKLIKTLKASRTEMQFNVSSRAS